MITCQHAQKKQNFSQQKLQKFDFKQSLGDKTAKINELSLTMDILNTKIKITVADVAI